MAHHRAVPTYDYDCRSCGNRIEVIHSMLEDGPTTCEVCGGALRRVIHPTGIIFKGSGFYKTDSRSAASSSGSRAPAAGSGDGAATDGAGKASGTDTPAASPSTEGGAPASTKKATGEKSGSSTA